MNKVEAFITAHIGENIDDCDDNFAIDIDKCNFAVTDGSSSDFFSNLYAKLLADSFLNDTNLLTNEESIININNGWHKLVEEELIKAGCKRGSFPYVRYQRREPGCSTIIGLTLFKENDTMKYRCTGLGDSVLFFIPNDNSIPKIQFSSYSNEDFSIDQNVKFGYTPVISNSYSSEWIKNVKTIEKELVRGVFYIMTDGLAEWILRKNSEKIASKFEQLDKIHSQEDFQKYVDNIRLQGAHNDDMTLLKIYIDELNFNFPSKVIYDYRVEQEKIKSQKNVNLTISSNEQEENESKASSQTNKKSRSNDIQSIIATVQAHKDQKQVEDLDSKKTKIIQDLTDTIGQSLKDGELIQQDNKSNTNASEEELDISDDYEKQTQLNKIAKNMSCILGKKVKPTLTALVKASEEAKRRKGKILLTKRLLKKKKFLKL